MLAARASSSYYQAGTQKSSEEISQSKIIHEKNLEAQVESKLSDEGAGGGSIHASPHQSPSTRIDTEYFPSRKDLKDAPRSHITEADKVTDIAFFNRNQEINALVRTNTRTNIIYQKIIDEFRQSVLDFLKKFQNNKLLPQSKAETLIAVLKNEMGNYDASDRAKAAATFGQQPVLPEDIRLVLKEVIDEPDQDQWVKIQAVIALSYFELLPNEYIQVLLDGLWLQTAQYEASYRATPAVALCQQSILTPKTCSILEEALRGQDRKIQLKAAIALAGRGRLSSEAISILLDAVRNENKQYEAVERANAVYALSQESILHEEAYLVLEAALEEQNQDACIKIEIAIILSRYAQSSEAPITTLLNAIKNKKVPLVYRRDAAFALGRLPILPESARLALKGSLQNDDKHFRPYAATALARHELFLDKTIPILVEAIGNKQYTSTLRGEAALTLGGQAHSALPLDTQRTLEEALNDPDSQVHIPAAVALVCHNLFLDEAIPILVKAVGNKQCTSALRSNAALGLGKIDKLLSKDARRILEEALNDPDSRVKIQAAATLAYHDLFLDKVIAVLVEVIGSKQYDNTLRGSAVLGIVDLRPYLLPQNTSSILKEALSEPNSPIKLVAAIALACYNLFLDEVIPVLVKAVDNKQYTSAQRSHAALRLGKQTKPLPQNALSILKKALNDPDSPVKIHAAITLASHNLFLDKVIPILVEAVGNKQYANVLRGNAAYGLGRQRKFLPWKAQLILKEALSDPDNRVQIQAAITLVHHELFLDEVIPILVKSVKQYDDPWRGEAAFMLGQLREALPQDAQLILKEKMNDPDSGVKVYAAYTLAKHDLFLDEVIPVLVEVVSNKQYDNALRGHAAFALYGLTEPLPQDAQSTLREALNDPYGLIKIQAASTLAYYNLFLDEVIPVLVEVVSNKHYNNTLRANAASVLSRLTEPLPQGVLSLLKEALYDPDYRVQIYIAFTLARHDLFFDEVTLILAEAVGNKRYDDELRSTAAFMLNELRKHLPKNTLPILREALNDSNSRIQIYAAFSLVRRRIFLDKVIPILIKVIGNEPYDNALRGKALLMLSTLTLVKPLPQDIQALLKEALNKVVGNELYNNALRGKALLVLSTLVKPLPQDIQALLKEALNGPDEEIKIVAAIALAPHYLFLNEVIPTLVDAVCNKQHDKTLRCDAASIFQSQPALLRRELLRRENIDLNLWTLLQAVHDVLNLKKYT